MSTGKSVTKTTDDGSVETSSREKARDGPRRGEDDEDMAEIRRALSRRQPVHSTQDDDPLDPIEWTVRQLVPIPENYFWEYTPDEGTTALPADEWQKLLPWHLKTWHRTIGSLDNGMKWIDRWIAQPVANGTGLTAPRMSYVTDFMTEEEWEASRRRLRERQGRVLQDSETGDGLVLRTIGGKQIKEGSLELESIQIESEER